MISITEKTADSICKEFRGLIESINEERNNEQKQFERLKELHDKRSSECGELEPLLWEMAERKHKLNLSYFDEAKTKYTRFIEVLMLGESA